MKFAYFGIPHIGGTYTVYRRLRDGLAGPGIEVRWLEAGPKAMKALTDPAWECERDYGAAVAVDTADEARQAAALADHIRQGNYHGVFINAMAGRVQTNLARYLPSSVLRVMIVHTISPATYRAAAAVRGYVHATVGVSPRIQRDLIKSFGFSPDRTFCIPNAVNLGNFREIARKKTTAPLKLLFLGRVDDAAKGVFWLPNILSKLGDISWRLTVAGDGPEFDELKRRCIGFGEQVNFAGRVELGRVPEIFAEHDIFLMPSRLEGFGLTLIEAMAAGCVPVASRIHGVTDFVVEDGATGLLFPVGDTRAAAAAIKTLYRDDELLQRMSTVGRRSVEQRFPIENMADEYARLIHAIAGSPPSIRKPLPMSRWKIPTGLRPGLHYYLPLPVKNWLRKWLERLHV